MSLPESYRVQKEPDGCWNCKHRSTRYLIYHIPTGRAVCGFGRIWPRLKRAGYVRDIPPTDRLGTCDHWEAPPELKASRQRAGEEGRMSDKKVYVVGIDPADYVEQACPVCGYKWLTRVWRVTPGGVRCSIEMVGCEKCPKAEDGNGR